MEKMFNAVLYVRPKLSFSVIANKLLLLLFPLFNLARVGLLFLVVIDADEEETALVVRQRIKIFAFLDLRQRAFC